MRNITVLFIACVLTLCLSFVPQGCSSSRDKDTGPGPTIPGTGHDFGNIQLIGYSDAMPSIRTCYTVWDNGTCFWTNPVLRRIDLLNTGELDTLATLIDNVDFPGLEVSYTTGGDITYRSIITLTNTTVDKSVTLRTGATGIPAELDALWTNLGYLSNLYSP